MRSGARRSPPYSTPEGQGMAHVYTTEEIHSLREQVIELRNGALEQNDFQLAVVLSHVVAAMAQTLQAAEVTK